MIKFDLSGADFSPRAEKLEPWIVLHTREARSPVKPYSGWTTTTPGEQL